MTIGVAVGDSATARQPVAAYPLVDGAAGVATGILFIKGFQAGHKPNVRQHPARPGHTPNNWFGRSLSPADSFLARSADDIQVQQSIS